MKSRLRPIAVAAVRGWTGICTWGLPSAMRESRRAEIESDLWESQFDARPGLSPALQIIMRLLLGIPDDLRWRVAHASITNNVVMLTVAVTTSMFLRAAVWMIDLLKAEQLPVPPRPAVLTAAPPPAPPLP